MLLTLRKYNDMQCHRLWLWLVLLFYAALPLRLTSATEGDPCTMKDRIPGICTAGSKCKSLENAVNIGLIVRDDIISCGFNPYEELICCPIDNNQYKLTTTTAATDVTTSSTPRSVDGRNPLPRPSVVACQKIDEMLSPAVTHKIIAGVPAALGEFRHMAAIGFGTIGNDRGPYQFRCGGTLIDKRFVLTAAHCVSSTTSVPAIVRLGVVNFTDTEQISQGVELRISNIHIHPDYSTGSKYNDIAILELEQDVVNNSNILPTCLYTETEDPPDDTILYVTGWGTVNIKTKTYSDLLLKARLKIANLNDCNASFVENGLNRQISRGIIETQLCAQDYECDPNTLTGCVRDSCWGDSGGPLNMLVDESYNKYRVLGIISAGFSCSSSTPGLYTRVASYLDYIESIVWPTQS